MMINLIKFAFVIPLLITSISCSQNVNRNSSAIKGYDEKMLSNGEGLDFESFEIIPLEQTEKSIINTVKRVEMVDTLIIVQSQDKLLSFSRTGRFICQYGDRGNGPDEYLTIFSYAINRHDKTIKIVDESSSKILTFDMNGNYLSHKKYDRDLLSMWTNSAIYFDDSNILFTNMIYNDNNAIYTLFNTDNERKNVLSKFPVKSAKTAESIGNTTVTHFKETYKLLIPFDNTVYRLEDGKMIPTMSVLTTKPIVDDMQFKTINDFSINTYADFMNNGYFCGFTGIFETDNYILLDELFGLNYFLVNKKSNNGRLYSYAVENELKTLPFMKIIGCYDNYFIGVGDSFRMVGLRNKLSEDSTDSNVIMFKNYIDEISYDSNPCLFLYQLK